MVYSHINILFILDKLRFLDIIIDRRLKVPDGLEHEIE